MDSISTVFYHKKSVTAAGNRLVPVYVYICTYTTQCTVLTYSRKKKKKCTESQGLLKRRHATEVHGSLLTTQPCFHCRQPLLRLNKEVLRLFATITVCLHTEKNRDPRTGTGSFPLWSLK